MTYADGQRFQASASFAAKKQGEGGWFYEMLGKGEVPQPDQAASCRSRRTEAGTGPARALAAPKTDRDLLLLALEEWWREDKLTDTAARLRARPSADHLQRAAPSLAADLGA